MQIHHCIHGRVLSTLSSTCEIGKGITGWKYNRDPHRCPWLWYMGDCPAFEPNPKYKEG